jgi:hypothetical protein
LGYNPPVALHGLQIPGAGQSLGTKRKLRPLSSIDSGLEVSNNPALTSLAGLEMLTRIGGMGVAHNPRLTDVSALSGLTSLEAVGFEDNPSLAQCAIDALLAPLVSVCTCKGNDDAAVCP